MPLFSDDFIQGFNEAQAEIYAQEEVLKDLYAVCLKAEKELKSNNEFRFAHLLKGVYDVIDKYYRGENSFISMRITPVEQYLKDNGLN
jgi:hypothetical protein